MKRRKNFTEDNLLGGSLNGENGPTLTWQQSIKNYEFWRHKKITKAQQIDKIFNHFDNHYEISDKSLLVQNMCQYCAKNKIDISKLIPLTFIVQFDTSNLMEKQFKYFLQHFLFIELLQLQEKTFQKFEISKQLKFKAVQIFENFTRSYANNINSNTMYNNSSTLNSKMDDINNKNKINNFIHLPETYNKSQNFWLFKPSDYNRGRGIEIFTSISDLKNILLQNFKNNQNKYQDLNKNNSNHNNNNNGNGNNNSQQSIKHDKTFVFQKYLEKPLLIFNRKFDIRIWVLISEGYLRLASTEFDLKNKDKFIHLTNNAIQIQSKNYGAFEDGNQMSFQQFNDYLVNSKNQSQDCYQQILDKIKKCIIITLKSVKNKINQEQRKGIFEIFGYDFIIDKNYHPWLIEVNTNPCLDESSNLLKQLLPRMLDDAFKLTIDKCFQQQKEDEIKPKSVFPVDGYSNDSNMWENLDIKD